jgi:FKBP-type peptidyl-prolyl cis-trans isomerase (trigger factor)
MGKKKTQGKPHAQNSFEQLVAKANREALKPYIHELFMDLGNDLSQRVFRQLANIQTRIMALEEILISKLGVSEAEIQLTVANIEDEATGYRKVDRGAEAGDLLRVSIETKAKGTEEFTAPVKRQITRLLNQPYSLTETIEKALVGVKAGETKEVTLEGEFQVRVTIDRVSESTQPKVEAVQPEAQPESQNTESKDESANA